MLPTWRLDASSPLGNWSEIGATRKLPHPLLPPGINTINPGVVQVGSGLGGDCLSEVMGHPAIILDVAVALRWCASC